MKRVNIEKIKALAAVSSATEAAGRRKRDGTTVPRPVPTGAAGGDVWTERGRAYFQEACAAPVIRGIRS